MDELRQKAMAFCRQAGKLIVRWTRHFFDQNVGMRLAAIFLAVLLWAVVISQDDAVRFDTISGILLEVVGEEEMHKNGFAIKQDLDELAETELTIRMEGSRAALTELDRGKVRAVVDLSQVTSLQKESLEIEILGVENLTLTNVSPGRKIDIDVEHYYETEIPVTVVAEGTLPEGYTLASHSKGGVSVTPETITISGTASEVQKVRGAVVQLDLTGATESINAQHTYTLVDEASNPIEVSGIRVSAQAVVVKAPIYVTKTVPIEWRESITGAVASGYEVGDVTLVPSAVTIAGSAQDVAGIDSVLVSAFSVSGAKEDFTTTVRLVTPDNIAFVDYEKCEMSVQVKEISETVIVSELPIRVVNAREGDVVTLARDTVTVAISGPASYMKTLQRDSVVAFVDLISAAYGTTPVPVEFLVADENAPGLTFTEATVQVTIEEAPVEEE